MKIRCSSLDRIMSCAGSLAETAAPYNPQTDEATEGTAAHEALAQMVMGVTPDLDGISTKHRVDRDVLGMLVAAGRRAWDEVKRWFPSPEVEFAGETRRNGIHMTGHMDVGAHDSKVSGVLDWKAGWAPTTHDYQVLGYATLAADKFGMPESGHILAIEVWLRAGELRVHRFSADDLKDFWARLVDQVARAGKQWGPSADACRYCPRQNGCQARSEWLRSGVTALVPVEQGSALTREVVGSLYDKAKQLRVALERYDEVLDAMLVEGPVPLGDGRRLVSEPYDQDKIRPSLAMPILDGLALTPEERDEAITVTKSGLERVAKSRAPKGKAAALTRDFLKRLGDAQAIEKISKRRRKVVA